MKGLTKRQFELLGHVKTGGADGLLDFDQLLDLLSWIPSKESAQFTIRALVGKGLLVKAELQLRRGRKRVCYDLTLEGKAVFDPRVLPVVEKKEVSVFLPEVEIEDIPGVFEGGFLEVVED